jgi:hypothetical protein
MFLAELQPEERKAFLELAARFPEKRHPSERRRAAIEDSVDGMEV